MPHQLLNHPQARAAGYQLGPEEMTKAMRCARHAAGDHLQPDPLGHGASPDVPGALRRKPVAALGHAPGVLGWWAWGLSRVNRDHWTPLGIYWARAAEIRLNNSL